jgi:hypothetical protein
MTITRDPEFPIEVAQLMSAFNRCADGSGSTVVLNASVQMVVAAICVVARAKGASLHQTESYARHVTKSILTGVQENYQRAPKPTDVVVKTS